MAKLGGTVDETCGCFDSVGIGLRLVIGLGYCSCVVKTFLVSCN